MPNREKIDLSKLPRHIAIIMDGNGRWARKRGLARVFGHRQGMKTVQEIVEASSRHGIQVLTLYAFSTENWSRSGAEVKGLMSLLRIYLRKELRRMMQNNIRLNAIGDITRLPEAVHKELKLAMQETGSNTGMVLNLALNYGARQEITRAFNSLIRDGVREASEESIAERLYTAGMPDPDLVIRTSGEARISNFLLWQISYSELYFSPVLWPDFREKHLFDAILEYQARERRFGGA